MIYIPETFVSSEDLASAIGQGYAINVRCCRNCEYFERDDGDFGYCAYKTDFSVLDDEPIHWYFTDINGFCREDDIND